MNVATTDIDNQNSSLPHVVHQPIVASADLKPGPAGVPHFFQRVVECVITGRCVGGWWWYVEQRSAGRFRRHVVLGSEFEDA